ncbi:MAG: hypothetical protein ACLQRM_19305, partial [Acidimicrobiales bacterium]
AAGGARWPPHGPPGASRGGRVAVGSAPLYGGPAWFFSRRLSQRPGLERRPGFGAGIVRGQRPEPPRTRHEWI